jgi:hypothetical protein
VTEMKSPTVELNLVLSVTHLEQVVLVPSIRRT